MQEYLGVHGTDLDHCMHDVFHVVFGYVIHFYDCVIVCYTLRGKTYTRYDVYGKCDCAGKYIHGIMYIGKSGMVRLGTITSGVRKMK